MPCCGLEGRSSWDDIWAGKTKVYLHVDKKIHEAMAVGGAGRVENYLCIITKADLG